MVLRSLCCYESAERPLSPQHSWIDVSDSKKNTVLYTLFRWMVKYKYPSLVCLYDHDKWVVLVSFRTSDDPRVVTNPTLLEVGIHYPYYQGVVANKKISAGVWWSSGAYWKNPVPTGQLWKNKWVGIGEPPEVEGTVQVEMVSRTGEKLINPDEASQAAQKLLAERRKEEADTLLRRVGDVRAAQPMLVHELPSEQEEQETEEDVRYYIVPFVQKDKADKKGVLLARLSVLVNAYTGRFEELCTYPRPVRYLSERRAMQIASRNLGLNHREAQKIEAELIFRPLPPHVWSDLPAWKIRKGSLTFFVTQAGLVLGTLVYPSLLGG